MGCRGLFVGGTDTAVGKTYVSCQILAQLHRLGRKAGAYKPACSGAIFSESGQGHWEDIDRLSAWVNPAVPDERICPQRFLAPLAPPRAARLEGRDVDLSKLHEGLAWWKTQVDWLVIEGAGGLLSPLHKTAAVADLAAAWGFPLLIVARAGLGTLNHTLMSIEVAEARGLRVAGVILNPSSGNDDMETIQYNLEDLQSRTPVPVLGCLPWGSEEFDIAWSELFDFSTGAV